MTDPSPMPEHLSEIRKLLSQNDPVSVQQGIALLRSLADPALWALFATDVELESGLDIVVGSEIETHVAADFRADVAFWALRETGQLEGKTQLRLGECRLLTELRPLAGLTALESLDLSDCSSLTSLDGIERLPALRALELSNCSAVDLDPLRQVPSLTALRLGNRETLTTLTALTGLTRLESLDLSGCAALTTLNGLHELPALREVRLDGCDALTSLAGLPATVRVARTSNRDDPFPVRHEARASWMSETEGDLRLDGLKSLDELEAEALVATVGTLQLNGLETISDAVAALLARHPGSLQLDGLETLSDAAAMSLAQRNGSLSLNGLKTLSAAAAAALVTTHTGDLTLRGLEAPTDADEVFAAHDGRVSLGEAFQYICIGRFDSSNDVETYGERVDATPLIVPVEGESTFTLKYQLCWPCEVKVGVIDDDAVATLLKDGADDFEWTDYYSITSGYGVTQPASTLVMPDGTERDVTLRHWPRSGRLNRLALEQSERGDFLHITLSTEKGSWYSHTLTLMEGTFDLSRVRVAWEGDFAEGYTYVHEDGTTDDFESDFNGETRGKGVDCTIYLNTGTDLVAIDFEELTDELEESGIDAQDVDAVRTYLLNRESGETTDDADTDADWSNDFEDEDDADPDEESGDDEPEDSSTSEEVQLVAEHLETFGFRPDSTGWLQNVLKGSASGTVQTAQDVGPHYSRIRSVIQLSDGTIVSAADEGVLRFWDPTSLRCIRSVDTGGSLDALLALPDARFLAEMAGGCTVWAADADTPSHTLNHGDSTLMSMHRISDEEIATRDETGVIRVWETTTWTVRSTRRFDGLDSCAVLDMNHLLVQIGEHSDSGFISTDIAWNFRTDILWQDATPPFGPRSTATLRSGRWATTDGGTRVFIRDVTGTLLRTIELPLRRVAISHWGFPGDAWRSCGFSGIASLPTDELVVWGAREGDGAFVLLRCDTTTGSCQEIVVEPREEESIINVEELPIGPHGMLVRLPPADGEVRVLLVPAASDLPPLTLIAPRGRRRVGFEHFDTTDDHDPRGALDLQDGRILTWGWAYDHAIRLWSSEGVPVGAMGTVSRFWTRDPLENTLLGAPE